MCSQRFAPKSVGVPWSPVRGNYGIWNTTNIRWCQGISHTHFPLTEIITKVTTFTVCVKDSWNTTQPAAVKLPYMTTRENIKDGCKGNKWSDERIGLPLHVVCGTRV